MSSLTGSPKSSATISREMGKPLYQGGSIKFGGLALSPLQDWASVDKLAREPDSEIQRYGRVRERGPTCGFEALLERILPHNVVGGLRDQCLSLLRLR